MGRSDPKAQREAHYKRQLADLDRRIVGAEALLTSAQTTFENISEKRDAGAWQIARAAVASADANLNRLRRDREHMVDMSTEE